MNMVSSLESPVLSICIPIYNRLSFLERMLERFMEDKDLFGNEIELIISDNCSEEDLPSCVKKYQNKGLIIQFHRQITNVGSDGNFKTLFGMAKGKYYWLLGSDDIPVSGFVRILIDKLRGTDYGLFHIRSYNNLNGQESLKVYDNNHNQYLEVINYWITFQSASIFRTETIRKVPLDKYDKSWLIQVPVFLNSCFSYPQNAIYEYMCFEKDDDTKNNGGYNFFKVFVENLFNIFKVFIDKGLLTQDTFERIKEIEYKEFLVSNIVSLLSRNGNQRNYRKAGAWSIIFHNYGTKLYAYRWFVIQLLKAIMVKIKKLSEINKVRT